ncbi:MAG: hypothetical protein RSE23_11130, partial [Clostridia bacterium]
MPIDQVQREAGDVGAKGLGEHQRHHAHHEQRIEQAPDIASKATAVLHLEAAHHKLVHQRTASVKVLHYHSQSADVSNVTAPSKSNDALIYINYYIIAVWEMQGSPRR